MHKENELLKKEPHKPKFYTESILKATKSLSPAYYETIFDKVGDLLRGNLHPSDYEKGYRDGISRPIEKYKIQCFERAEQLIQKGLIISNEKGWSISETGNAYLQGIEFQKRLEKSDS
jgi:hypothetical protein